jgi:hypothetical protein
MDFLKVPLSRESETNHENLLGSQSLNGDLNCGVPSYTQAQNGKPDHSDSLTRCNAVYLWFNDGVSGLYCIASNDRRMMSNELREVMA